MTRGARLIATLGVLTQFGCGDASGPRPSRSFLMGFSAIPPRNDTAIVVTAINLWAQHADAAIIHASPPWAAMLAGASPAAAVDTVEVPLANHYRAKHLARFQCQARARRVGQPAREAVCALSRPSPEATSGVPVLFRA